MGLLSDIFDSKPNQQTSDEAKANYAREQALYQAALDRRMAAGTISPQTYQQQTDALRDTLDDPTDAGYAEFKTAVNEEVSSASTYVKEVPGKVAGYAGELVGKTVSGAGGGLFKGLFGNSAWFTGSTVLIIVVLVFLWKPLLKPILGKIKIIPV